MGTRPDTSANVVAHTPNTNSALMLNTKMVKNSNHSVMGRAKTDEDWGGSGSIVLALCNGLAPASPASGLTGLAMQNGPSAINAHNSAINLNRVAQPKVKRSNCHACDNYQCHRKKTTATEDHTYRNAKWKLSL